MSKEPMTTVDVTTLQAGDVVHYHNYDQGKFLIDQGEVRSDNIYKDGVQVHGDDWKQYVGKWFICKVVRGEEVIFEQLEEVKEDE